MEAGTGRGGSRVRTAGHCAAVLAVVLAGLVLAGPGTLAGASAGGSLRLIIEPQAGMGGIDRLLSTAHHGVDLEMYELDDPAIESILAADAARGVRVRVILDKAYIGYKNAARSPTSARTASRCGGPRRDSTSTTRRRPSSTTQPRS